MMIQPKRTILLCLFFLPFLATSAQSQQVPLAIHTPVSGISSYDAAIPTPDDVLGYTIGTRHTTPAEVVRYFEAVAAVSPRVEVLQHAASYEGRALIHAIVSSPGNHARLDAIRSAHHAVSDFPSSVSDEDLAALPVVVYQAYSVHGNEASGTEAALVYLYHLAAGIGPAVDDALEQAVVIIEPMLNPDGRDRFADWVNRHRGGVHTTDPNDLEHNEPWPGGRTNHYWFDLNRDWLVTQHPESQGRMALFHTWRPHVLTDHHEMGGNSTFFFQPGIPSSTNPNTSDLNQELTGEIATYHAAYLDRIGASYFSGESFDDFFYGKGSAFPDINGAVGILFEQGSSRALESEVADGLLHYAYTVRNQFLTSLSTLEAAVEMRPRLLAMQRDFYSDALARAERDANEGWLIDLTKDRTRAQRLAQLLSGHRIRIHELAQPVNVGGETYAPGDAYVVPAQQPQYRLIRAGTERTLEYRDSLFYDVSTWTLPLAFNVDFIGVERLGAALGQVVSEISLDGGNVRGVKGGTGYMLNWDRFHAPAALYELLDQDILARVTTREVVVFDGSTQISFPPGSIYVSRFRRDGVDVSATVDELVESLAERWSVEFHGVATELTPIGPDLGGPSVERLSRPVVAIIAGSGVSSGQAGEAWHALSERFRIPASLLDPDRVSRADLDRYSVIVVPGGGLDTDGTEAITRWVRGGGRLLVMAGATGWAVRSGLLEAEEREVNVDSLLAGRPWNQLSATRGAQAIGGTIFEMELDVTHPLSWGVGNRLPGFHNNSEVWESKGGPGTLIGRYVDEPLLSGYVSEERLATIPGAATVMVERHGGGRVVAFANRLNFRAYWLGTQRLFMNAVMFAPVY